MNDFRRSLTLLIPAFSLRRDNDLGIGDTAAVLELLDWAAAHGVSMVQLLPINECGPDNSPYNAISSVALDPVYLDVSPDAVSEVDSGEFAAALAEADATREDSLIDYAAVRERKTRLLRSAHTRWLALPSSDDRRTEFDEFCEREKGWLESYCAFKVAILDVGHECWDFWPEEWSDPDAVLERMRALKPKEYEAVMGFHAWLQWLAASQWTSVRAAASERGLRLMGDIPIGVNRYSADVFFNKRLFDLDWCGGSPAEPAFTADPFTQHWGQNWGIPLYRWLVHEQEGFAWWRQRIQKCCEVFDVFRIDHILGFYRLYAFPWRPQRNDEFTYLSHDEAAQRTGGLLPRFFEHDDDTEEHQRWNREHGDWLLRMVQHAANGAEIVGEDLGTVPPYVRPHLMEIGIPGFKIPHWEESPHFPEMSFATYATHDHPPLRVLWEGAAAEGGGLEAWRLATFSGMDFSNGIPEWSEEVKWKLIDALVRCPSRHVALMPTDLFGMTARFNVPGTAGGANWRFRLPWTVPLWNSDLDRAHAAYRLQELSFETQRAEPPPVPPSPPKTSPNFHYPAATEAISSH